MRRRPDASEVRNAPFGELVTRLLAGYSTRDIWAMTGVSHTTIGNMMWGVVPSFGKLTEFADGMEKSEIGLSREDRAALFATAGYAPSVEFARDERPGYNTASRLLAGIEALSRETGKPIGVDADMLSMPMGTEEDVQKILEIARQKLTEEDP